MNRYQKLTQDAAPDEALTGELLNVLKEHGWPAGFVDISWEDLYWVSRCLYLHDDSGASDELIIKALEHAHAHGMNLRNNREVYLDGVMMLAAKHLKYGQYFRTINYITELRDNGGDLPDWVHIYYCVAMTYAYPRSALTNPEGIIASLRAVRMQDKETRRMTQAAIKRYLDVSTEMLDDPQMKIADSHLNRLHEVIKEKGFDRLPEWDVFIRRAKGEDYRAYRPEPEEEEEAPAAADDIYAQVEVLREENQSLHRKIQHLEERLLQLQESLETVVAQPAVPAGQQTASPPQCEYLVTARRKRLLVFGDSRVTVDKLRRYANAIGFPASDIDFHLDYERNGRFNLNSIQYHSPYVGILVGPNAHSMVNLGDYPSMIAKLRDEPGFPHSIEIRTLAGELKITKTSFETALLRMIDHITAIGA